MAQKTDLELIAEANVIRDETAIGANTALRVGTMLDNLIDSKINNDMVSDSTSLGNSTTLVPSQNAVKTYVDAFATGLLTDNGNYDPTITSQYPTSGNTLSGGAVQKGDIWYISADGTINGNSVLIGYSVRALIDNAGATTDANWSISNVGIGFVPENVANKSTDVNLGTSDVYYPSQNAVKTYVDAQVTAVFPYTPENIANKSQDIISNPSSTVLYPSNKAVADYIAYGIDLQAVTDSGNTTTVDIHVQNSITSENGTDSSAAYLSNNIGGTGAVGVVNKDGYFSEIKATNLTGIRTAQLPDADGTLALTSQITNSIQTLKVSFNNSALNGLSSPYTAIAAPGAGKFVRVISVFSNFTWGATPMTVSNPLVAIGYSSVNFLSCSASAVSATQPLLLPNWSFPLSGGFGAVYINQPLEIKSFGTLTGGVGNILDIYITYEIVTL